MRYLVIDSASEACSVAVLDDGAVVDHRHEILGRGHAERLVPLIAELIDGGRADSILVGCGPGSFAGVRIGVAAARGLALGWEVPVHGVSSLALVAASAAPRVAAAGGALVVMEGGHGQWFVQPFTADMRPRADVRSLVPAEAIAIGDALVIGNRAEPFVGLRGYGEAMVMLPDVRAVSQLPESAFFKDPSPIYGRAPDAKPMGGFMTGDQIRLATARVADLSSVMHVMEAAFDPIFGEAWSAAQLLTLFALPSARICVAWRGDHPCGFSAARIAGPESELLLLAVDPAERGKGIGALLMHDWKSWAEEQGANDYFLEMRADNDAVHLYERAGFSECGRRPAYYRGSDNVVRDAITMRNSK